MSETQTTGSDCGEFIKKVGRIRNLAFARVTGCSPEHSVARVYVFE